MRTLATMAAVLVVGAGGCMASPQRVAVAAQRHEAAAARARDVGDYRTAEAEQRAADRQWRKAYDRAGGRGLPPPRPVYGYYGY
jgi:hypothetical protein